MAEIPRNGVLPVTGSTNVAAGFPAGFRESVLFWHVRESHYGDVMLNNLSFVRVGRWDGDLWARKATGVARLYIDDHADDRQPADGCVAAIIGGPRPRQA